MSESGKHFERGPEVMREQVTREILELLARIVETGPELQPSTLQALRDQVQYGIQLLGLRGLDDEMLVDLVHRATSRDIKFQVPKDYPSPQDFAQRVQSTTAQPDLEPNDELNHEPSLHDIIWQARGNWQTIQPRGFKTLEEYLYQLGQLMSDERAYRTIFPDSDAIAIRPNWLVENGRHRVLTLKSLGADYAQAHRMDQWVKAKLEIR